MKNQEFYKRMAKVLKDVYQGGAPETGVEIVACNESIEVRPSKENTNGTLFLPETAVDFARLHHLNVYVSSDIINGSHCAVAHLF